MIDTCTHRVKIHLKTRDIWDLESRLIEVYEIRSWLDELTEWQPDMYELRFHSSGSQCVAWFADERYAMLCALKYS